ncbi:MAG TPA: methyltransferase domain-containing protein [Campylobacterales bacterium]|nr:methyltransferase domain-containing protein [Campylobacterales bacterium]HIP41600.1 methyltransferase domain-containing protein [Campylobacterales bacterium]
MNVIQEFSRFANLYDSHNIIQLQVAKKLVSMLTDNHYKNVLDMGCGSGAIYKNMLEESITFEHFMALDLSLEMLGIHPDSKQIEKKCFDFNASESFEILKTVTYNVVLSSSALQWSSDLDMTLRKMSGLSKEFHFAFFTANTFATLHQTAGISSPIYTKESIQKNVDKYYHASYETLTYTLKFESVREMFQYIKRSGVSGGKRALTYTQTKEVMRNYSLDYLEFEVLFIHAKPYV